MCAQAPFFLSPSPYTALPLYAFLIHRHTLTFALFLSLSRTLFLSLSLYLFSVSLSFLSTTYSLFLYLSLYYVFLSFSTLSLPLFYVPLSSMPPLGRRLNCIQTDHKAVMAKVESSLHALHEVSALKSLNLLP